MYVLNESLCPGSADTSCVGLVSSSTNTPLLPQVGSSSSDKKNRAITIALSVTFGFLAISGIAIAGYMYLRKRRLRKQALLANITPRKFMIEVEAQVPTVRRDPDDLGISSSSWGQQSTAPAANGPVETVPAPLTHRPTLSSATALSYMTAPADVDDGTDAVNVQASFARSGQRPGFNRFPTTSIRLSMKAEEAKSTYAASPDSEYSEESFVGTVSVGQVGVRNGYRLSGIAEGRVYGGPAATYQHEDAGIVRESPPPYVDRGEGGRTA